MALVMKQGYYNSETIAGLTLVPQQNMLTADALVLSGSRWAKNQAAAVTYENEGKTAVLTTDGTNTRPFLSYTYGGLLSLATSSYYAFGFDVERVSGTPTQTYGQADATAGRNTATCRFIMYFQASGTTPTLRMGLGAGGAESAGIVYKFSNPFLVPATSLSGPTPHFYTPPSSIQYFGKVNANTQSAATNGTNCFVINSVLGTDVTPGPIPRVLSVVGIGDSFSNDATEYPKLLAGIYPGLSVYWNGVAGRTLVTMATEATDTFSMSGVPVNQYTVRSRPSIAVIQGGTNDALTVGGLSIATALANAQAAVLTLRGAAIANGARVILSTVAPAVSFTADQKTFVAQYNAWVRRFADESGSGLWDINTILRDPADFDQMLAAYSDGQPNGIHPNDDGELAITQGLVAAVRSTASAALTVSGVMSVQVAPGIVVPF